MYRAVLTALGVPAPFPSAAGLAAGRQTAGAQSPAGPNRCESGPQRPLRILLAEDNPVNQRLAVSILEKQEHIVVVARNGREALAALGKQTFDAVLMDVQMPEMDGLEATSVIREREKGTGRHVPVIAMTAYAMKGDRERCLEAGMDSYVAKPVRAAELFRILGVVVPTSAVPGPEPESGLTAPAPAPIVEDPNWDEALERVGGDRQLLRRLAELCVKECPQWLAAIRTALAESDPAGLQRAAHTLKGGLGTFAAKAAWEAARRLETLAREGDLAGGREALAGLAREVERLQPILTSFARQPHGPHPLPMLHSGRAD